MHFTPFIYDYSISFLCEPLNVGLNLKRVRENPFIIINFCKIKTYKQTCKQENIKKNEY